MYEDPDDLNYEFNFKLFLAKTGLSNLESQNDKQRVLQWLKSLSTCRGSLEEMKLRNDFMHQLVLNVRHGELQYPFNQNPPPVSLTVLAKELPEAFGGNHQPTKTTYTFSTVPTEDNRPLIYKNSPDGGAFLAAQPIPKCGAFCYLAVVGGQKKDDGNK